MLFSVCFFFYLVYVEEQKGVHVLSKLKKKNDDELIFKKNILEKEMFTAILADFSGCEHA